MAINRQEIEKVANLSRLALDEAEIPQLTQGLQDILALVDQMQAVDTTGVEPMANPLDAKQRLRVDEVTETNQRDALQSHSPAIQDGLILVPKVTE